MEEFSRIQRLPPYVFNITGDMKPPPASAAKTSSTSAWATPTAPRPNTSSTSSSRRRRSRRPIATRVSRGLPRLRKAICNWYKRRYDVDLDPETEAIVTIGSKEGIAHLCLAMLDSRDTVLVPNPSYPIHIYGPVIAGAHVVERAHHTTATSSSPSSRTSSRA